MEGMTQARSKGALPWVGQSFTRPCLTTRFPHRGQSSSEEAVLLWPGEDVSTAYLVMPWSSGLLGGLWFMPAAYHLASCQVSATVG